MVSSYLQLLARRYRGRLDEDADAFIGYAVDGAERMKRLINDLLSYARLGARTKPFGPVDCNTVLEGVRTNLGLQLQESQAELQADPLPTVTGDPTLLLQLFQNLIGNALKFRGKEAPRVSLSAEKAGAFWTFRVRDNGIGLDPECAERIFVIFGRLHTQSEYPGTGIGLALCKKIVERHGGRIGVDSSPGTGSTFWFTLPA